MSSSCARRRSCSTRPSWPRRCGTSPIRRSATEARSAAISPRQIPPRSSRPASSRWRPPSWWTGAAGERRVAADDFFRGVYETALEPGDILTAVEIPARPDGAVHAFRELARRAGDYAIVGLALSARRDGDALSRMRPVFFAAGSRPTLATAAAAVLEGRPPTAEAVARAQAALAEDLEPQDDLQASAAMRLHLARVLLARTLDDLLPAARDDVRMSA